MILEDSYLQFLIEHKLTQGQFLLLYLIYKDRGDLILKYKENFPTEDGTMIGKYFIDDLLKKGFLEESLTTGTITIGKKFKEAFINKHRATEEIFDIYPTHFSKDGVDIPLTAMDRNVFANLYDITIQSSFLEHEEILKDIQFGKEKSMLNLGIEKFLKSHYWKVIREIRLSNKKLDNIPTVFDKDF
jgi:hypothetical protein